MNAELDFRLLNDFQRGFPLASRPYARIAKQLGASEEWVMARLAALQRAGSIGRVGAVFAPGALGASTLAALEVPPGRLQAVAGRVSARPEVNHNYERDHRINLWFVVTAESSERLAQVLDEIERSADCGPLLDLPLIEEFRIDLGFDLGGRAGAASLVAPRLRSGRRALTAVDRRLLAGLQEGLLLVPRPYAALAERAGVSEADAIVVLANWVADGTIRRLGVIVRHRELGYRANAMVVWEVPDGLVQPLGLHLAQQEGVTLCYRRRAAGARWPYNLYCMIHGRARDAVLEQLRGIRERSGLGAFASEVLFSRARFKQTGARYVSGKDLAYA